MPATVIEIVLWVPFGIVFLISVLFFCRAGYKWGLWRALVSLGSTILAAVASLFLSKLAAIPVSGALIGAVGQHADLSELERIRPIFESVVQGILALFIFSFVMFIMVILCKVIFGKLLKKYLYSDGAGSRWAGLAVRLADALIFTLLLLLPLYGTINAWLPAVDAVMELSNQQEDESREIRQVMDAALAHPVSQLSNVVPANYFYRQITSVPTDRGNLDIVAAVQTMPEAIQRTKYIVGMLESGEMEIGILREFIQYLRQNVIGEKWCYTAAMELLDLVTAQPEFAGEQWQQLLQLSRMKQKDFVANADALLSFGEFILDEQLLAQIVDKPDPVEAMMETGVMEKLGQTINATEQAVSVRQLLVQYFMDKAELEDESLRQAIGNAWSGAPSQDPQAQLGHARAFMRIVDGKRDTLQLLTASLSLTAMDKTLVHDYVMNTPLDELLPDQIFVDYGTTVSHTDGTVTETPDSYYYGWTLLQEYLGGEEALRQRIWERMQEAAASNTNINFSDSVNAWMKLSCLGTLPEGAFCSIDYKSMDWAISELGPEYFVWLKESGHVASGETAWLLAKQCHELLESGEIWRVFAVDDSLWALARLVELCTIDGDREQIETCAALAVTGPTGAQTAQALAGNTLYNPKHTSRRISEKERKAIFAGFDSVEYISLEEELPRDVRIEEIRKFLNISR